MRIKILIVSSLILMLLACSEQLTIGNNINGNDNSTTDSPPDTDKPDNTTGGDKPSIDNGTGDDKPSIDNDTGDDKPGIDNITCTNGMVKHSSKNICVYIEQRDCNIVNLAFPGNGYSNPDPCLDDPDYSYFGVPVINPGAVENPTTELEILATKYPYGNYGVRGFTVDYNPNGSYQGVGGLNREPSVAQVEAAKRITIDEKKNILRMLAIARFVLNTPEYEREFLTRNFCATMDFDFPWYKKYPMFLSKWLDRQRLLYVIRNHKYYEIDFRKTSQERGITASASGGIVRLYSVYDEQRTKVYRGSPLRLDAFLFLPNRLSWVNGNDGGNFNYNNDVFLASLIFHETLHHFGLIHTNETSVIECHPSNDDPVYRAAQQTMGAVLGNNEFRSKYKAEMDIFREFYVKLYADMLNEDTVWIAPKTSRSSLNIFSDENSEEDYNIISCPISHY